MIVLLCERRKELIAQTIVKRQLCTDAPIIGEVRVPLVLSQIALALSRRNRRRLRQSKQKVRDRGAGRRILRGVFSEKPAECKATRRV